MFFKFSLPENIEFQSGDTITKDPEWTGEKRHIDSAFIQQYIKDPKESVCYISGPPAAVEAVSASLASIGIPADHLHASSFTGY